MKPAILLIDVTNRELIPAIKLLASWGYELIFNGGALHEMARLQGLPARLWSDYTSPELRQTTQQAEHRLKGLLPPAMKAAADRGLFTSHGVRLDSLGPTLARDFLPLASQQIASIALLDAVARQRDLAGTVFGCDNSPVQRALVLACRRSGIPTIQLAHAIYGHGGSIARPAGEMHTLYADKICVFGERARRDMMQAGTADDRIIMTGAPHWDALYSAAEKMDRHEACHQLGLDPERPVVLYCAGYADGGSGFFPHIARWLTRLMRSVFHACRSIDRGIQLVVRPHPHERNRYPLTIADQTFLDEELREWAYREGHPIAHISRGDKMEAYLAADVAISAAGSSVIPELMILDRPTIGVVFIPGAGLLYDETDGVAIATEPEALREPLERLLTDDAYRNMMRNRARAALPELNFGGDGQSCSRVAEAIDREFRSRRRQRLVASRSLAGKRNLRILLAAHDFFPFGKAGTERYTRDLALAHMKRGHEIEILHPRPILDNGEACRIERSTIDGIAVARLLVPKNAYSTPKPDFIKPALREFLREAQFDVVHAQHLMGLGVPFIETVKEENLPLVLTANDFYPMCEQIHLMSAEGGTCTGPETIDKCVHCARRRYNVSTESIPQFFFLLADRHYALKAAIEKVDLLLCPSKHLMDTHERHGFTAKRIVHAPQGAVLSEPLSRKPSASGRVRVRYFGHLAHRKGLDILVRAFNQIRSEDAELHIHGINAEPRYSAEALASVRSGRSVTYHGEYGPKDLPGLLSETDLVVVPSRGENYPFVIREVLHHGVPVVASDVAGIPEIVHDRVNGRLFSPADPFSLTRILDELIEDPGALETLRCGIQPMKSIEQDAAEIEEHYLDILGSTHPAPGVNVVLVAPHDQFPTLVHRETAQRVAKGFAGAGLPARLQINRVQQDATNIFVGFEWIESTAPFSHVPTVALQIDPLGNDRQPTSPLVARLRRAREVWSYCADDVRWLRDQGIASRMAPIGAGVFIDRGKDLLRDLDVVVEGPTTERQEAVLRALEPFCEVTRFQGAQGSVREDLYVRCKIALFVRPHAEASIPIDRLIYLMERGVYILAESPIDETFSVLDTASHDDFADRVRECLMSPNKRMEAITRQRHWVAEHPISRSVKSWLENEPAPAR